MRAKLGDRERTAACLVHMAAGFAFERHRARGWYAWCVENAVAAADTLESSVWMALRFEVVGEPDHDFLEHLEQTLQHATVAPARRRDAQWLLDGLKLAGPRAAVAPDGYKARWLRDAFRASELPPSPAAETDREASR